MDRPGIRKDGRYTPDKSALQRRRYLIWRYTVPTVLNNIPWKNYTSCILVEKTVKLISGSKIVHS